MQKFNKIMCYISIYIDITWALAWDLPDVYAVQDICIYPTTFPYNIIISDIWLIWLALYVCTSVSCIVCICVYRYMHVSRLVLAKGIIKDFNKAYNYISLA